MTLSRTEKDKIVKEIAEDLYLREDVVREVLDRWQDIAIEKTVNEGRFKLSRFFSISTTNYKGYSNNNGTVPPHSRLSMKLSDGVRKLFKMKNSGVKVDRDNWKELLSADFDFDSLPKSKTDDLYNPLLDDDDEL